MPAAKGACLRGTPPADQRQPPAPPTTPPGLLPGIHALPQRGLAYLCTAADACRSGAGGRLARGGGGEKPPGVSQRGGESPRLSFKFPVKGCYCYSPRPALKGKPARISEGVGVSGETCCTTGHLFQEGQTHPGAGRAVRLACG